MSFNGIMPNNTGAVGSVMTFARPISDDIKMKGVVTGAISNKSAVTDGTYIYLSPDATNGIIRINKHTEEVTKIPIVVGEATLNVSTECMVCDERYLWIFSNQNNSCIIMDLVTNKFELLSTKTGDNGNSNMPSGGFIGKYACYDGENIWVVVNYTTLVKIDAAGTKTMTTYSGLALGGSSLSGIQYSEGYLWIINPLGIYRLDVKTMEITKITVTTGNSAAMGYSSCYSSEYLYTAYNTVKGVIRVNPLTNEETLVALSGDNMSTIPTSVLGITACAFDGKYWWIAPSNNYFDRLVRFDTETELSKGFLLSEGYDMSTLPSAASKFRYALFDGQYIWLIPISSDRVVKVYTNEISYKVIVKHQTENGMNVKTDRAVFVYEGATYEESAPVVTDYTCVGHKIDNEAVEYGKIATINDVRTEHTVIFIYRKNSDLQAVNITEKYQLEDGTTLAADTIKEAYANLDYSSTAPKISGYICVGYKVDNDAKQTGSIATIRNVVSAHVIVFYYQNR